MTLADLGAEVVKVERPGTGDDTRQWGPPWTANGSSYFECVNRSKQSITLDLRSEEDLALARSLVVRADVLVENFLTGTMERLGLGYDEVSALNPRLVYCSITGFGSGVGGAPLPGYDFVVQALGGLMSITGDPEGEPTKAGVALVDVLTGKDATIGILAALQERERSGRGQRIEVNLLSSLLGSLANQASAYLTTGTAPGSAGQPASVHRTVRDAALRRRHACRRVRQRRAVRPAVRCPRTRGAGGGPPVRHEPGAGQASRGAGRGPAEGARPQGRRRLGGAAHRCRRRRGCGQRRGRRRRAGPTTRPVPDRERRGRPPGAGPPPDHLVAQPPAHPYAAAGPRRALDSAPRPTGGPPMSTTTTLPAFDPHDPAGIDDLLSDDERAVRASVRRLCEDRPTARRAAGSRTAGSRTRAA